MEGNREKQSPNLKNCIWPGVKVASSQNFSTASKILCTDVSEATGTLL